MEMTYEEAKAHKQKRDEHNIIASDNLKAFYKFKNEMGVIPDHIKAMPEYKVAKKYFDLSFHELRKFNSWFVKTFKKEIAAERNNRFASK